MNCRAKKTLSDKRHYYKRERLKPKRHSTIMMTSPLESSALNDGCNKRKQINAEEEPCAIIKRRHATKVGELIKVVLTSIDALEGVEKEMEAEAAAGVKPTFCSSFIVARELFEGIEKDVAAVIREAEQAVEAEMAAEACVAADEAKKLRAEAAEAAEPPALVRQMSQ